MPYGLLIAVQIAFAIHAYRTGRMYPWLFILVFVPGLGCLLYLILEIGPELLNGRASQQLASTATKTLDPGRRYRELTRAAEIAPTVQNKINLAEEALRLGRAPEAAQLYEECATGLHATEPAILLGLARARFANGDATGTLAAIAALRAANPTHRKPDTDLLEARALDAAGRPEEARALYATLAETYPGEEARARYADLLARLGNTEASHALYAEVIRRVELQGKPYRRAQRDWYDAARQGRLS
jgi:hypothetical protein